MNTIIYMVRHAESPYNEGTERTRGLTVKGKLEVEKVTKILQAEGVDTIVSSPYKRAILTVEGLAQNLGLDIEIHEDLREKHFSDEIIDDLTSIISDKFYDFDFYLSGGESNSDCQKRSISVLKYILNEYAGKRIAIGTHEVVMTLMLNYFDSRYGSDFLNQLSKPDIYKLTFVKSELKEVIRL